MSEEVYINKDRDDMKVEMNMTGKGKAMLKIRAAIACLALKSMTSKFFDEIKDFVSNSQIASALTGELSASFESGGASYQVQINFYDKTGFRNYLTLSGSSSGGLFTEPEIITTANTGFDNIFDFANNEYTFKLALTSIQGATNATFKLSSLDGDELKHKYWYNISFDDKIFYGNIAGRLSTVVVDSQTAPSAISDII